MSTLDRNLLLEMFRKMEEIRRMDLKIAQLVKKGKVPGMTHFSVGEEAANVGAMLALNPDDLITSNHRGHGQAIAKGIDLNGMMAEILGKYTGTCKGKGGSMHIADLDAGNLGAWESLLAQPSVSKCNILVKSLSASLEMVRPTKVFSTKQ